MPQEFSFGIIPVYIKSGTIRFLLLKSKKSGHWMFPKGRKNLEEADLEAARREFQEETGIAKICLVDRAVFQEKWTFMHPKRGKVFKTTKYFLGLVTSPNNLKIQPGEVIKAKWMTLEEAEKQIEFPSRIQIMKEVLKVLAARELP